MSAFSFTNPANAVPIQELPDPFLKPDGGRVSSPGEWPQQREYLKEMLAHYLYGHMPPPSGQVESEVIHSESCFDSAGIRERVCLRCGPGNAVSFELVVSRPAKSGSYPVFVWNQFQEMEPSPLEEKLLRSGYAIAMFDRTQLAADDVGTTKPFEEEPVARLYPEYDWRAIGIWAWGHSVVADFLQTTDYADMTKLISTGFSRGGKVALWAAICDERFAACAVAGSGCGGAGNFRFMGGRLGHGIGSCESLGDITKASRFWYWFSDNCAPYGNHEAESGLQDEALLPFDLHVVRALIAPRPLITVDGLDDTWANPYGTQISWQAANEVYGFLDAPGHNAMHFREGGHGFNVIDWEEVLRFCENTLRGAEIPANYKLPDADTPKLHYGWRKPE